MLQQEENHEIEGEKEFAPFVREFFLSIQWHEDHSLEGFMNWIQRHYPKQENLVFIKNIGAIFEKVRLDPNTKENSQK